MNLPVLVVVSGPPGAGKTTVAAALRDALGLPLVAKDTLKEALGDVLGTTERAESHRLGSAVFEAMRVVVHELLAHGISVIAEGNFTPRSALFLDLPRARIVQVHVTAPPDHLRSRLLERDTHRHAVHYDADAADEIRDRAAAGEWDPLPLDGRLVLVDTTEAVDVSTLAAQLFAETAHEEEHEER